MSLSFNKRLSKEIQLYQKDDFKFPNLILKPTDNLELWYFIVHDLKDTEYENGIYLGKVMLPPKYPFKAPDFQFLTPSGRFEINKKLCTSFTGYHQELYSPSWNIASMCAALTSFMTDSPDLIESKGIGGMSTTIEFKQQTASESRNYIKNNKFILDIFENYFKEYYDILNF
jgi:ubiquitin-conjugating enzyme E2 J1